MREFRSNSRDFIRRTRRRVIIEMSALLILIGYFWSDWSDILPEWVEVLISVVFAAYILFGLAYYPKAKAIAQGFFVCLMDDALGFPDQEGMKQIPYRDLTISNVKKKNGDVITISLETKFGQSITLQSLENMNELYEGIATRIGYST